MEFLKDILLIDFETTDIDFVKAEPIAFGAVLLDRKTLEEKKSFQTLIAADLSSQNPESAKIHGITQEKLTGAPDQATAIKQIIETFGTDVLLASWVQSLDHRMLEKMLIAADLPMATYDFHYLDLWPAAYLYLVKKGTEVVSIHSQQMIEALGIIRTGEFHDALNDCRIAAEALRKMMHG